MNPNPSISDSEEYRRREEALRSMIAATMNPEHLDALRQYCRALALPNLVQSQAPMSPRGLLSLSTSIAPIASPGLPNYDMNAKNLAEQLIRANEVAVSAACLRQAIANEQKRILQQCMARNLIPAALLPGPLAAAATTTDAAIVDACLKLAVATEQKRQAEEALVKRLGPLGMNNIGVNSLSINNSPNVSSTTAQALSASTPPITFPTSRTFPSERSSAGLIRDHKSPSDAVCMLKILGSTIRSKADTYVDCSDIPKDVVVSGLVPNKKAGDHKSFPMELFRMLEEVEREGLTHIVSFLPHGRAFRVHEKELFVKDILPRYFVGQSKWSSWTRQLYMYGMLRNTTSGRDYGAYYSELFLKGRPDLCQYMTRVGAPRTLDRRTFKLADGEDPNFYSMKPVSQTSDDKQGVPSSES